MKNTTTFNTVDNFGDEEMVITANGDKFVCDLKKEEISKALEILLDSDLSSIPLDKLSDLKKKLMEVIKAQKELKKAQKEAEKAKKAQKESIYKKYYLSLKKDDSFSYTMADGSIIKAKKVVSKVEEHNPEDTKSMACMTSNGKRYPKFTALFEDDDFKAWEQNLKANTEATDNTKTTVENIENIEQKAVASVDTTADDEADEVYEQNLKALEEDDDEDEDLFNGKDLLEDYDLE